MNTLNPRTEEMARLYAEGWVLEEIGLWFGITRERVRQILRAQGVTRQHGGQAILRAQQAEQRRQHQNDRCLIRFGHDYATHEAVRCSSGRPMVRFNEQRRNAAQRGIEWQLTFAEWWSVWEASGHWNERGRGQDRYVMSRRGDVGPYSLDNVYIQLSTDNNSDAPHRQQTLPKGVKVRMTGGRRTPRRISAYLAQKMVNGTLHHIGSFRTEEEAVEAYRNFRLRS